MLRSKVPVTLLLVGLLGYVCSALGHADGPGTCVAEAVTITGMPSRMRNNPGEGPFAVTLDMMGSTYIPGNTHFITISSDTPATFTGFLVYGETTLGARVGVFDKSDANVGSPRLSISCPADPTFAATAAHTSVGPMSTTSLSIPWQAPNSDVGPIHFRAIVLGGVRGQQGAQEFFFPSTLTATLSPIIFTDGFED